jgi:hypothetical protein
MEVNGLLHDPGALPPGVIGPRHPLDKGLGGLQSRSGRRGEDKHLAGNRPRAVHPVAIPTPKNCYIVLLLLLLPFIEVWKHIHRRGEPPDYKYCLKWSPPGMYCCVVCRQPTRFRVTYRLHLQGRSTAKLR